MENAQLPLRLDDWVSADNPVRAIDAYVDSLDLSALGFDLTAPNPTAAGQPAYPPASLLKLYLYAYVNRLRSSRVLDRECQRNLELIWLVLGFQFSHKTIADFRKRNGKALRRVHADFIALCKDLNLLGGKRAGVDGSHFNGNVSDKSFRSLKSLAQDIEKLEQKAAKWLEDMDAADREGFDAPSHDPGLPAKLEKLKALQALKKTKEEELKALEASGETQRSATDPDARQLNKRGQKTAGYNVQIVVDDKHKLIVADDVVQDGNDLNQSLEMAGRVADFLEFGELMCLDALERRESCGGHFREEYQFEDGEAKRDDENFAHVAAWEYVGDVAKSVRHVEPLTYENIHLAVRSYK